MGLQRYLSGYEDRLLLQQTQGWFPEPTPRGSHLPVIPGLRYQDTSGLNGICTHMHIAQHRHKYTQLKTNLKKKKTHPK